MAIRELRRVQGGGDVRRSPTKEPPRACTLHQTSITIRCDVEICRTKRVRTTRGAAVRVPRAPLPSQSVQREGVSRGSLCFHVLYTRLG